MAEENFTTNDPETQVKIEAYAAIQRVKEIVTALAGLAVLRMQAAEGVKLSKACWADFYQDAPWGFEGGDGLIPHHLEEGLNEMVFRYLGAAWSELDGKVEKVFEPDFVKDFWHKKVYETEGHEA